MLNAFIHHIRRVARKVDGIWAVDCTMELEAESIEIHERFKRLELKIERLEDRIDQLMDRLEAPNWKGVTMTSRRSQQ